MKITRSKYGEGQTFLALDCVICYGDIMSGNQEIGNDALFEEKQFSKLEEVKHLLS